MAKFLLKSQIEINMIAFPIVIGINGQYTVEKIDGKTFILIGEGYPSLEDFEIEEIA